MANPVDILVVGPQLPALLQALEAQYTVHKLWLARDQNALLAEQGSQIRGLVTSFVYGVSTELLNALPALEIIASYGVGLDRIDLNTVQARNIILTYTPDIYEPVADTALALLLAVTRRVCEADRFVRGGHWAQAIFPFGVSLQGKTCGIVGMGRIGQAIATRASAFGLKIAYYGPRPKPELPYSYFSDLATLAQVADFLILALPGGPDTHHLIDERCKWQVKNVPVRRSESVPLKTA